uniref:Lysozyme n=1 Tax=Plectus sambesii TaxID=2011161 RepID=A0A914WJ44_9BILA
MHRLLLAASLLVSATLAAPLDQNESTKITYGYAVDVAAATSTATFNCYGQQNYRVAFVQIYQPINDGMPNPNGPTNIQNAVNAGLGVEVFVTPSLTGGKQGYEQLDEAYNYVTSRGVNVKSIWLQVTSPINWPSNQQNNANFIYSFLARAQQRNLGVGIYTNAYDWMQITSGWTGWSQIPGGVRLWYWHVTTTGPAGQTDPTFNDFTPFSGFYDPLVKQYAQYIYICSTNVNINVYKVSNKQAPEAKEIADGKPVVGLLMGSDRQ